MPLNVMRFVALMFVFGDSCVVCRCQLIGVMFMQYFVFLCKRRVGLTTGMAQVGYILLYVFHTCFVVWPDTSCCMRSLSNLCLLL